MLLQALSSVGACRRRACSIDSRKDVVELRSSFRRVSSKKGFSDIFPSDQWCTAKCDRSRACYWFRDTGLHAAKFRNTGTRCIRTIVHAKANEANTDQHQDLSNRSRDSSNKLATGSFQGAAVNSVDNSDPARLSNEKTLPLTVHDSLSSVPKKLTDLKSWWTAIHATYKEDLATWGHGTGPIFTVFLGPNSQIEKVSIEEEELKRRLAGSKILPAGDKSRYEKDVQQKILLAESIAKDLESGTRTLNRHSTVVSVVQHPSTYENLSGQQKSFRQMKTTMRTAAPMLSWVVMLALPLYVIFMVTSEYRLMMRENGANKENEANTSSEEASAATLEKMRTLKAQMSTNKGNTSVKGPPMAPAELMQRILEVREMARKVRAKEGVQTPVEILDTGAEEYKPQMLDSAAPLLPATEASVGVDQGESEPQVLDLPAALFSAKEANTSAEHGKEGHKVENNNNGTQVLLDTTRIDADQAILQDTQVTELSTNEMQKPVRKVKPRIITSIDEAMTILGSEDLQKGESGGRTLINGKSHMGLESLDSSKPKDGTLGTNDSDNHLNEFNNFKEQLPNSTAQIVGINSRGHGGDSQSHNHEFLQKDNKSSLERPYTNNFIDTGKESQSTEGQTLELESDGVTDSRLLDESQSSRVTDSDQKKKLSPKDSAEDLSGTCSRNAATQETVNKSFLNTETDEVVGSGQPLKQKVQSGQHKPTFSNTKRWSKQLQRKYDVERDPEIKGLMREIGSELDSWITEEEIEKTNKIVQNFAEEEEEQMEENYKRARNKIKDERERFGLDAVLEKYKEYQPEKEDELWWLDLRYVLCLMVANKEGEGLYGLDLSIDEDGITGQAERHVVGFEDRKDALNLCRLMEMRSGSKFMMADVRPFSPERLLEVSKEEGFQVTVLRSGQIQTHVDQTLEEVEEKIAEIGRSVYWDNIDREHSMDMDSILHQRFGL